MARKKKGDAAVAVAGATLGGEGIRLSAHPRARRHIAIAKGWGGLIAFVLALKLSRGAGILWPDAIERSILAGVVGYLAAWALAQTIWRHIALAELEQLRGKLVRMAEAQQASREAEIAARTAEAEAAQQAAAVPQAS